MDYSASTVSQQTPTSVSQQTPTSLYEAISQLDEVSWQLNDLIFGATQTKQPEVGVGAGDKLTEARNQIQDITVRLKEVKNRLAIIGG